LLRNGHSFSGRERNCCYLNTGGTQFADVSAVTGLDFPDDGRGVAVTDWDGDGRLDFWVVNRSGPQLRFMHNRNLDGNHFLALRLQGTTCNRDAIGARVEVVLAGKDAPDRKLVKTMRAGESFLSQSTKWFHFGLGKDQQILKVTVRWPDGAVEEIAGIAADRRFRIVQGQGRAKPDQESESRQVRLKPAPQTPSPASDAFRVFLASRLPLPRLAITTATGDRTTLYSREDSQKNEPVLLNIWASWCQPCIKELKEFSAREEDFRQAGLKVMLLSVNPSEQDQTLSAESAAIIKRFGIPFEVGVASHETIEKLQLVNNAIFTRYLPLPVPCSLLVDGNGELAALYRGPVAVERVLQDVQLLETSAERRLTASLPFAGRRLAKINNAKPLTVVEELLAQDKWEEASAYARRVQRWWPRDREFFLILARLGNQALSRGDAADAEEWFRESLRLDNSYKMSRAGLAMSLERQGRPVEAVREFKAVLRSYPDNLTTLNNLAWMLATHTGLGEDARSEAVEYAHRAAEVTDFSNAEVLDTLAAAYASAGQYSKATEIASQAIELFSEQGASSKVEEVQQRRKLYLSNQPYRQ
jgi:tetratricopeptide (TPR) repeat protein